MARPKSDPTLTPCHFRLGAETLGALDTIAREVGRRTGRAAGRTDAVRWAASELLARLELARGVELTKAPVRVEPGPFTRPRGEREASATPAP